MTEHDRESRAAEPAVIETGSPEHLASFTTDHLRVLAASTRPEHIAYGLVAQLGVYLAAKHHYEELVAQWGKVMTPGEPVPDYLKQHEQRVAVLKRAGGTGDTDEPLCCRSYGRLHEPAFSLPGCRWYDMLPDQQPGPGRAPGDGPEG